MAILCFVDKETGETTLSRDDVSGSIPIGDARFRQTTNSPEEMLDILRNPQNGMQEVLDAVGISLEIKLRPENLIARQRMKFVTKGQISLLTRKWITDILFVL